MLTPDQIVRGYQAATERLRADVVLATERLWLALPDYRDASIDTFKARALPILKASNRKMAALTAAQQTQEAAAQGENVPMVLLPTEVIEAPRAVAPEVVYQRPATAVYTELSNGAGIEAAAAAGLVRLRSLVQTDLQMVKVRQAQFSARDVEYRYFVRVLTGLENCALCTIASTQQYKRGSLMPIHPGCDCTVSLRFSSRGDPGQVIDVDLLDRTHGQVEEFVGVSDSGGRDPDYRKLLITSDHGEYGPTLRWRNNKFTSEEQLADARSGFLPE